ncbi:vegetative cell wall protein gp1-like [Heterocephalus glaber]|uniref:Vegetative cell wall protein gp1-like n=1 Tax=Heterocephalus glaber TaxID=10181 RepID=A0AAX6SN39_HETGA|nr:vegetative cell wall protein gp1-like [Heterocephalus glaber]
MMNVSTHSITLSSHCVQDIFLGTRKRSFALKKFTIWCILHRRHSNVYFYKTWVIALANEKIVRFKKSQTAILLGCSSPAPAGCHPITLAAGTDKSPSPYRLQLAALASPTSPRCFSSPAWLHPGEAGAPVAATTSRSDRGAGTYLPPPAPGGPDARPRPPTAAPGPSPRSGSPTVRVRTLTSQPAASRPSPTGLRTRRLPTSQSPQQSAPLTVLPGAPGVTARGSLARFPRAVPSRASSSPTGQHSLRRGSRLPPTASPPPSLRPSHRPLPRQVREFPPRPAPAPQALPPPIGSTSC